MSEVIKVDFQDKKEEKVAVKVAFYTPANDHEIKNLSEMNQKMLEFHQENDGGDELVAEEIGVEIIAEMAKKLDTESEYLTEFFEDFLKKY